MTPRKRQFAKKTGLSRQDVVIEPMLDIMGKNSRNETHLGAIYITSKLPAKGARLLRKINKFIRSEHKRIREKRKEGDMSQNEIGSLVIIRHWWCGSWQRKPGPWFRDMDWTELTPQAVFALSTAADRYDKW